MDPLQLVFFIQKLRPSHNVQTDSVGFTRRHLHQRVDKHKNVSSSVGKHFRADNSLTHKDISTTTFQSHIPHFIFVL